MTRLEVTKTAWEQLREPFAQVFSGETKRVDVTIKDSSPPYVVKIYAVAEHTIRIDFPVSEIRRQQRRHLAFCPPYEGSS